MTQPKTSRIPAPLYAAAGAGELALQQLRKLPTVVTDLGGRVVTDLGGKAVVTGFELRQKATETLKTANVTAVGLREKTGVADLDLDLDKLRALAARNAAVVLAGAQAAQERALAEVQAAQERALAAYGALVARGERVVGAGVLEAAETVNADIEATEATTTEPTAATVTTTADAVPTPADVAEVVEAKPAAVKRARATKATATKATGATATPSAKLPKSTTKRTRPAAE